MALFVPFLLAQAHDINGTSVGFQPEALSPAQHEVFAMTLASLAIFIAAGGGTGGGGILDPLYILVMKLTPKEAIPLSSITIVGGAVANFILNVRKARPNTDIPLIDWDFILVMLPMTLLGAMIGTYLNSILPSWLLCCLLVVVLGITGYRTLKKAIKARQNEERANASTGRESNNLLPTKTNSMIGNGQKAPILWKKLSILFGLFLGIVFLNVLKGVKTISSPLGFGPSSFGYALLSLLPYVFLALFTWYSYRNIVKVYENQQSDKYIFHEGEIQWTAQSIKFFPVVSILAGIVSGMFGIGGGIINAPLLLELGIQPSAASAMTATMVLFSSLMSSCNYIVLGSLNFHFAAIMFPMGFFATWSGHFFLMKAIKKYNCPSLIIFSMAIIVLVSAVAMTVESFRAIFEA